MRLLIRFLMGAIVVAGFAWFAKSRTLPVEPVSLPVASSVLSEEDRQMAMPFSWFRLLNAIDPTFVPGPDTVEQGKRLAAEACAACHMMTPPEIFPKEAWTDVFEQLDRPFRSAGVIAGFDSAKAAECGGISGGGLGLGPLSPAMKKVRIYNSDYAKIVYYYLATAPEQSLPQENKPPLSKTPAPFRVAFTKKYIRDFPLFTFVSIVENGSRIVLGNASARELMILDEEGAPVQNLKIPGLPAGITGHKDAWYVTLFSNRLNPTPSTDGSIVRLSAGAIQESDGQPPETLLSNLQNPQSVAFSDFDGDGAPDMLVQETGFVGGDLSWYKLRSGLAVDKHVIFEGSGTQSALLADLNRDNRPDILTLIGRTPQSVQAYLNQGDGTFASSTIAQHYPGFGYQQMLVEDMNGDRRNDIITLNGDSFDLDSYPMRNYHGIRILGAGNGGEYAQRFFYPMYGVRQAVTRDFDGDGDLDIAAIAFGADFRTQAPQLAVYLENKGNWVFEPHEISSGDQGRWYSLDAADLNHDGDEDLVLVASYPAKFESQTQGYFDVTDRVGIMILENTSSQRSGR